MKGIMQLNRELFKENKKYCPICKQAVLLDLFSSNKKPYCKVCRNARDKKYRIDNSVEHIIRQHNYDVKYAIELGLLFYVRRAVSWWKSSAKRRTIPFDLTVDYIVDLYNSQDGKCYYTGRELIFNLPSNRNGFPSDATPSLDRLIPEKGYTQGNVVWCLWLINRMKYELSESNFYSYISSIVRYKNVKT